MARTKKTKSRDIKTTYRYREMLKIMDMAEYRQIDMITLSKTADYIAWLNKFNKIPKDEVDALAIRMTDIFELQREF
jgi:hypothetical protein